MMSEERKKNFNLYRYLCFPWGILVTTSIWFAITKAIESFLENVKIPTNKGEIVGVPWWVSWALFACGALIISIVSAVYSYRLPKGEKRKHNIFILISSEYAEDDRYITNDFVNSFQRYAHESINDLNIIVPAIIKRENFNRRLLRWRNKHKAFWTSNTWNKLHRKLKGSLYISGTLKRRYSKGKEKYIFLLSATVGYNDLNKQITPLMVDELQKNFPNAILIDRQFEFEEFEEMTNRFATFSEYLIGWAHLVSGNIDIAYKMHYDIYSNNKQSFFKKGKLNDLTGVLLIELETIIRECRYFSAEFVTQCVREAEMLFPNKDELKILISRCLIMISNDREFSNNLSHAMSLINKVRINSNNRNIVHGNRAYLYLLEGKSAQAETEYCLFFKKADRMVIDKILNYCKGQEKSGCSKERPTAFFVEMLMLMHSNYQYNDIITDFARIKKNIPLEYEYYHSKLRNCRKIICYFY